MGTANKDKDNSQLNRYLFTAFYFPTQCINACLALHCEKTSCASTAGLDRSTRCIRGTEVSSERTPAGDNFPPQLPDTQKLLLLVTIRRLLPAMTLVNDNIDDIPWHLLSATVWTASVAFFSYIIHVRATRHSIGNSLLFAVNGRECRPLSLNCFMSISLTVFELGLLYGLRRTDLLNLTTATGRKSLIKRQILMYKTAVYTLVNGVITHQKQQISKIWYHAT